MITTGLLLDSVLKKMDSLKDAPARVRTRKLLITELHDICKGFSVVQLRDKTDIDFSLATYSNGMLLPSDLFGIDDVRDADGNSYIERDRYGISPDGWGYRFYRHHPSMTGLWSGVDLNVSNGGTSFTSATLEAAIAAGDPSTVIGEYARFGEGLEYYLISTDTSPFAFTPTYYGPELTDGDIHIRPPETQRMEIIDPDEDVLQDRTMTVYYWKAPLGMWRDSDMIPLVSAKALELRMLFNSPESKEKNPVSPRQIKEAMGELKALNPKFPPPPEPRDKHGRLMDTGANPFGQRLSSAR